jgi:hypothetical protein
MRDQMLSTLEHASRPTRLPAYSQIVAARDGHLWVRVYTVDPFAAGTWDVYSPDRVFQGQVRTPTRFFVHAIEYDRLIGVWYDELDVEHVRAYGLSVISNTRDPSP